MSRKRKPSRRHAKAMPTAVRLAHRAPQTPPAEPSMHELACQAAQRQGVILDAAGRPIRYDRVVPPGAPAYAGIGLPEWARAED